MPFKKVLHKLSDVTVSWKLCAMQVFFEQWEQVNIGSQRVLDLVNMVDGVIILATFSHSIRHNTVEVWPGVLSCIRTSLSQYSWMLVKTGIQKCRNDRISALKFTKMMYKNKLATVVVLYFYI